MSISAWIMVAVCVAWVVLFLAFTVRDLREEDKKSAIAAEGKEVDPFMFTGERAREEARASYLNDVRVRKYFEEQGIVSFLDLDSDQEKASS